MSAPPEPTINVRTRRPAIDVDHRTFHDRLLAGDIGPGTYRVACAGRREVITIPSRMPRWVRAPLGRMWHRTRFVEVMWNPVTGDGPHMVGRAWCGQSLKGAHGPLPAGTADQPPTQHRCTWCDTAVPDRRRLSDVTER